MTHYYFLAYYAKNVKPIAWVTSGAPVELLRALDYYAIYPENHGALCGASRIGVKLCEIAEAKGFSLDICSYARIDLGHFFSGETPVGRLPKPDLLFVSNNICQTVLYWYKNLAFYLKIPLILFDTPYNYQQIKKIDINYMVCQIKEIIPIIEKIAGREFNEDYFKQVVGLTKETSLIWGQILNTMQHKPAPMTIFDAFTHLAPIVSLRGLTISLDYYKLLLKELQERLENGVGAIVQERKRLIWDNIPIWFKIREISRLFAFHGINFVAATYTNAWAEASHYLDVVDVWCSLAKAYSLVILNNNLNYRINLIESMIKEYSIDGLVFHSARSCKPYSIGQYDICRIFRQNLNIPSIIIESDIADSRYYNEEQTQIKFETFFEILDI